MFDTCRPPLLLAPPGYCPPCCWPPSPCAALLCLRAALLVARHPALPAMASLRVLTFDHEGCPIQFDTWLDDLQVYLYSDSRDSVSLFDHTSGASLAPPATADSATRSQWLTCDTAARLAIRNHLPLAECAHFGQYKTAKALYKAPRSVAPMYITLYFIVTRLPDSLRAVRDHFLALDPADLTVDLLEQHLLAVETNVVARGTPRTPFFEGCSPSPLAPSYASAAAVDVIGAEDVRAASASGKRRSSKGNGGKSGGGGSGVSGPDSEKWMAAMATEVAALKSRGTWKLDPRSSAKGRKKISGKWVFHIKTFMDGSIDKYKEPRLWQQYLHTVLTELGFKQLPHDLGMYRKESCGKFILLVAYVDDLLYTGNDTELMDQLEADIKEKLEVTINHNVMQFLGLNITQSATSIHLSAAKYAETLVKKFVVAPINLTTPYCTPPPNHEPDTTPLSIDDHRLYQQQVGCLHRRVQSSLAHSIALVTPNFNMKVSHSRHGL
ncbi:unnamed protein product [Closterium sp. NIES-53]